MGKDHSSRLAGLVPLVCVQVGPETVASKTSVTAVFNVRDPLIFSGHGREEQGGQDRDHQWESA